MLTLQHTVRFWTNLVATVWGRPQSQVSKEMVFPVWWRRTWRVHPEPLPQPHPPPLGLPNCKPLPVPPILISSAARERAFLNEWWHFPNTNASLPPSDLSEALEKMKGVYEQNPQMGDPSSLEPQITETAQNIGRLRGELTKYEVITHTC